MRRRTTLSASASRPANQGRIHTNLSGFVNVPRLDTNFASLGVNDTRTVGTNKAGLCLVLERICDLEQGIQSGVNLGDDPPLP